MGLLVSQRLDPVFQQPQIAIITADFGGGRSIQQAQRFADKILPRLKG